MHRQESIFSGSVRLPQHAAHTRGTSERTNHHNNDAATKRQGQRRQQRRRQPHTGNTRARRKARPSVLGAVCGVAAKSMGRCGRTAACRGGDHTNPNTNPTLKHVPASNLAGWHACMVSSLTTTTQRVFISCLHVVCMVPAPIACHRAIVVAACSPHGIAVHAHALRQACPTQQHDTHHHHEHTRAHQHSEFASK